MGQLRKRLQVLNCLIFKEKSNLIQKPKTVEDCSNETFHIAALSPGMGSPPPRREVARIENSEARYCIFNHYLVFASSIHMP
jgi:hypothetical protein